MFLFIALAVVAIFAACESSSDSDDSESDAENPNDDADDTPDDDAANDDLDDDVNDDTASPADDDVDDDSADDDTASPPDDDADDDSGDDDTTGDDDDTGDNDDDTTPRTSAGGKVYRFDWTFDYLEGGRVEVLEYPDIEPVVVDAEGEFDLEGARVGRDMTLIHRHDEFYPTQSATLVPGEEGIGDISFQVPPRAIVWAMSVYLWEWLDPDKCQIATTVTEAGGTPFSPGIAGAVVGIDPPLPPEQGPFYFEIIEIPGWPIIDLPQRGLTETTGDGGAIFLNVPPGEYVLSAEMPDEEFTQVRLKCTPGLLVNASPPYGLQTLNP